MHLTHMVIDDFFPDPDAVRQAALRLDYPAAPKGALYPGRNSRQRLDVQGIDVQIGNILGTKVVPLFTDAHAHCRIAFEGEKGEGGVHVDPAHWSAIICLSRDEDCRGGTEFFRHKRSGLDRAPVFEEDLEAYGYSSVGEVWNDVFWPETNDRSKWTREMVLPMKYNRLLLFRSYLWHDAGPGFGTTREDGRLIMVLTYGEDGLPLPDGPVASARPEGL